MGCHWIGADDGTGLHRFPHMTTPLLVHLEDLVLADYGNGDLAAVRARLADRASLPSDAPLAMRAKQFLDALAQVQHRAPDQVYVWAGTRLVAALAREFPAVFRDHTSTRTVLLQLGSVVSALAAELLPDASVPEFWEDYLDATTVRVNFDGPVEVQWLLEGATVGLAGQYGELVQASRGVSPASLPDRRLLDVKVIPDRRGGSRGGAGVSSGARRG